MAQSEVEKVSMSSGLREELVEDDLPNYTLTLPPGWEHKEPSEAARDQILQTTKKKLMDMHRPDLYGQLSAMMSRAFRDMQRTEVIAFFVPGPDTPDRFLLPASLTLSVRRGRAGRPLDDEMAQLIRRNNATALDDERKILRWESEKVYESDGARVETTTVAYFTPVPGTNRRKALQLTLVLSHDSLENEGEPEYHRSVMEMFDTYIATFSWNRQR